MLRRIGLFGASKKTTADIRKAAKGHEVEIVPWKKGEEPPPQTVAFLLNDTDPGAVVEAAKLLGSRHEELLNLLAEAIDCREVFAPGGSQRVQMYASRFGEVLGLNTDERLVLERGALMRDIGKLKIGNEVLLKEGTLTYDEWVLLQQHTHIGADLVAQLSSLKDTQDIVRRHHECYDGSGYPDQLEGEAIPYLARIVKIVDVYCAMTSPRFYREGQASHSEALDFLKSERGKHCDPELVDAFVGSDIAAEDTPG